MQTRSGKTYTIDGSNINDTSNTTPTHNTVPARNTKSRRSIMTRSNTITRNNISNEFAQLLGKPVEAKTLSAHDLRRMLRFVYDKYAGGGEPPKISNKLAKFLGKPAGSKMRRTEVLRHIETYVDTNNLIDNQARIKLDRKLATIIKMGENDELTYFNLLKHLNHHFL